LVSAPGVTQAAAVDGAAERCGTNNLSSEFIGENTQSSRQGVHLHCAGASVEG
jgi:hypothetical protein